MNNSVTIRPATIDDVPALARVHVDTWLSTYRGIVPDEYLDNMSYAASEEKWRHRFVDVPNRHVILVASDQTDAVIGFTSGGSARAGFEGFTGEIYTLYLLQQTQGYGIGRRLFNELMGLLNDAGHSAIYVWVLADNPSRGFYRKMGGELIGTKMIEIGGVELEEEAYGWSHPEPIGPR